MRIAWVLYGSLDQRTGGTIYDRLVVDGLRALGDDVRVVSLAPPPRRSLVAIPAGVVAGVRLGRLLRKMRPDVVVGDELCFRELAAAFPFLRRTRTKRVLLVHHLTCWEKELPSPRRWLAERAEHIAIDAADRMITTSHATRARLVRELSHAHRGGVPTIDVAVPGSDRLPRLRPERSASSVELVFVGAVIPRKRVLELVRAFARTPPRARLTLVGSTGHDRRYAREVVTLVEQLHLESRVVMAGETADEGVARHLSRADVLVMPSSLEGWGIAATEAMNAGVPVIAARTPGLEEALAPAPSATVFVDDERALGDALVRFTTDDAHRHALQAAAVSSASQMPTWAACVDAFRASLA